MKLFFSEFVKQYSSYTFSYAVYATLESPDRLTQAYQSGFLPYTGAREYLNTDTNTEIFYLARSLRINLQRFNLSSENRRVLKIAQPLNITLNLHKKEEIINRKEFHDFCQVYIAERFESGTMPPERWSYVLNRKCGTHIFEFKSNDAVIGYVLAGMDDESVHYWFGFFDTTYLEVFPIGKYLMTSVIQWAKENNKRNVYLGTCYGASSLYKVRDFKSVEFFDGTSWNANSSLLKSWCKTDDIEPVSDRYKELRP